MQKIRYLDKLFDKLAKGKPMDKWTSRQELYVTGWPSTVCRNA